MTMWAVRSGKFGEREQFALDNDLVTIGWGEMPDLRTLGDRDAVKKSLSSKYRDASSGTISNHAGQLWAFCKEFKAGDLVLIPLKSRSAIAIGRLIGDYEFNSEAEYDIRHRRKVEWIRKDLPRFEVDQDIRFSLGCALTVFSVERNSAESRIRALIEGRKVPSPPKAPLIATSTEANTSEEAESNLDLESIAKDQIVQHLQRRFSGHALSRLVEAVLQAEGYHTKLSPPGADGGVDVLAGSGPMGFDSPRIAVQVKSQQSPVDVSVFRELQGSMASFHAERGLLVAWAGFKSSVLKEAAAHHFNIRLWDSGDLLSRILANYDKLDDELKAELPLQRMWRLVQEDA